VLVNGKKLDVDSARLSPGDVITFREKSKKFIQTITLENMQVKPDWVEVLKNELSIKLLQVPERDQLDQSFRENLVVEYYSR
jgi:small subunit ribosomal protein S4